MEKMEIHPQIIVDMWGRQRLMQRKCCIEASRSRTGRCQVFYVLKRVIKCLPRPDVYRFSKWHCLCFSHFQKCPSMRQVWHCPDGDAHWEEEQKLALLLFVPLTTLDPFYLDGRSAMSSGTPPAAPPFRKGRKPEKPDVMTDPAQSTNEELKTKLMDAQTELQQERGKVRGRNRHTWIIPKLPKEDTITI